MAQSALEILLIMAYNVGRDNERTQAVDLVRGRERTVQLLQALVANIDPGDLAKPLLDLHGVDYDSRVKP